jgi:signal transduction histidine kinase
VATGWESARCAYATAFLPPPPALLPLPILALATLGLLGALAGAIYLAAASPVRRIQSLAESVRASAESRYAARVPAEGNDEIADLAGAFDEAAAAVRSQLVAVEKREGVLRDFVAHTTHDVGLPLSVLAGHLSDMRDRVIGERAVDAALVAAAAQETQYIASLLHNLGAVARLETEDALTEKHAVDLGRLVERVVLRHTGLARDAGVEINHAVPEIALHAQGDVTLLEQAVNNLVHNAIRYNRKGGHVAVVLDASGDRFELSVSDDGPGVTDAELPHLGDAHFRGGDARSRRPEGRGLGLSIAKAVAERHGFALGFRYAESGGLVARLSGARS